LVRFKGWRLHTRGFTIPRLSSIRTACGNPFVRFAKTNALLWGPGRIIKGTFGHLGGNFGIWGGVIAIVALR
jgi:hypothetical protein